MVCCVCVLLQLGYGESQMLDKLLYEEEVKRCIEQQFHYGVFYAYMKLREQEIRNIMWISECVAQVRMPGAWVCGSVLARRGAPQRIACMRAVQAEAAAEAALLVLYQDTSSQHSRPVHAEAVPASAGRPDLLCFGCALLRDVLLLLTVVPVCYLVSAGPKGAHHGWHCVPVLSSGWC
jgi:hypothetical protein